jgi:hypothetical protein
MAYKYKDVPGIVQIVKDDEKPPTSTLVDAFQELGERAADAIVLRGYLGQSDFVKRTFDYLERAKRSEEAKEKAKALDDAIAMGGFPAPAVAPPDADGAPAAGAGERAPKEVIQGFIDALNGIKDEAQPHVPWRLYLTPGLDCYVDFHLSSLIAYRREPRPERQDTCTVWLRVFEEGGQMPIPYRVVQETLIGPSFAAYLGGDLIDDYLGQPGSVSSAWGDQSAFGNKVGTGRSCAMFGRKVGTGTVCGE